MWRALPHTPQKFKREAPESLERKEEMATWLWIAWSTPAAWDSISLKRVRNVLGPGSPVCERVAEHVLCLEKERNRPNSSPFRWGAARDDGFQLLLHSYQNSEKRLSNFQILIL